MRTQRGRWSLDSDFWSYGSARPIGGRRLRVSSAADIWQLVSYQFISSVYYLTVEDKLRSSGGVLFGCAKCIWSDWLCDLLWDWLSTWREIGGTAGEVVMVGQIKMKRCPVDKFCQPEACRQSIKAGWKWNKIYMLLNLRWSFTDSTFSQVKKWADTACLYRKSFWQKDSLFTKWSQTKSQEPI